MKVQLQQIYYLHPFECVYGLSDKDFIFNVADARTPQVLCKTAVAAKSDPIPCSN